MRAFLLLVLLVGARAHATWHSTPITGTPRDVVTPDAGLAVVARTGGGSISAIVFPSTADGGISLTGQSLSSPSGFTTAVLRGPCLIGLTPNATSTFISDANCGSDTYSYNTASGRLRVSGSGDLFSYTWGGTQIARLERLPAGASTTLSGWASVPFGGLIANGFAPLSATTIPDGGTWVGIASSAPGLALYREATAANFAGVGSVRDVWMYAADLAPGAVVVTDGGELLISSNVSVPDGGFFTVPVQAPFSSVTFTTASGTVNGVGFGMAAAGGQLYSPVPNPNAVGRQWVVRTGGGTPANLVRVSCFDPTYCAGIAGAGGQNVWAYFNSARPAAPTPSASVPVGGASPYFLDAGDADGDPVWVRWTGGGYYWDGGDPRAITILGPPGGASCGATPTALPITGVLSDGYGPHDQPISIPVVVTDTAAGVVLLAVDPVAVGFTAGDPPDFVKVFAAGDGGCPLPPVTWSISGGGFTLTPSDGGVTVAPPPVFCSGSSQTFTLTASAGADASVSLPVTLAPWGGPIAPVFTTPVQQTSGTDAGYSPVAGATHACDGIPPFPGTRLVWSVDGGAPGVTVVTSDTAITVYSTNACVSGTVVARAKREVLGTMQQSTGVGTLTVQLVAAPSNVATAGFDAGFVYDAINSTLTGSFSTDATCAAQLDLRAGVEISVRDGGPISGDGGFPVPGPWALDVPGGCEGGRFEAVAFLTDDAGTRLGPTAAFSFDTVAVPAQVPELATREVAVSCAMGAQGTLALLPGSCAAQRYRWTQVGGPALIVVPDAGAVVAFATSPQDLQAQAGQRLTWSVTATTGPSSSATQLRSVLLVPTPFVEITHRTDVPIAREEEAVGVEVILKNPTACAVTGVVLREALGGLKVIPGSVRILGAARPDVTPAGDLLEVPGLSLPALGAVRVTYLARVPLLSSARPRGVALLGGTDVTVAAPGAPAAGCGCGASPAGLFALLALGGALVRSRRRSGYRVRRPLPPAVPRP